MADSEREFISTGFVDKRRIQGGTDAGLTSSATAAYHRAVVVMRTQLNTFNSTYYTTDRLNGMTRNDMVYALRQAYDSAGI